MGTSEGWAAPPPVAGDAAYSKRAGRGGVTGIGLATEVEALSRNWDCKLQEAAGVEGADACGIVKS